MDKKTVDSAIKGLEERELVKKVCRQRENGTRTSNLYHVFKQIEYAFQLPEQDGMPILKMLLPSNKRETA